MNEWMKKLLGDDLYTQVEAKLGDKKVVLDDGELVPKARVSEIVQQRVKAVEAERDQYKTAAEKASEQVEKLKPLATGNEQLTAQLNTLSTQMKTDQSNFEKQLGLTKKSIAVKEALLNSGVLDADARDLLATKFDLETIAIDRATGKPVDFDNLVAPLKTHPALKNLFGEIKMAGQNGNAGQSPDLSLGEWGPKNPFSKKFLNLTAQVKLKKEQPELASRLEAAAQV